MKKVWARSMSFVRGPFRFYYKAYYEADDGSWKLVLFKVEGYEQVSSFTLSERIKLIQKFGRQAARAAHEEAEKPMKIGKGMV